MTVIHCDLCYKELNPRDKCNYSWFAKGGLVALYNERVHHLYYGDRRLQECCPDCASKHI